MSFKLATRRTASVATVAAMLAAAGAAPASAQGSDENFTYTAGKGVLFKTQSGDFALRGRGLFTFDYGAFSGGQPEIENDRAVRDAIALLTGRAFGDFTYQFIFDFADDDKAPFKPYKNVVLTYEGLKPFTFTVGNQKVPFSQQHLTGPPQFFLNERGLPFALAPRRRVGASVGVAGDRWQAHGGVFGTNINESVNFDDRAYGLRATYAPKLAPDHTLHFGAAANYVDPDPEVSKFGFPPETLLPGRPLVASGPVQGTDSFWRGNLELGGVFGPLSVQSEYSRVQVDRDTGSHPTFHAGHLQAAYVLTGESRPYIVAKNHMFRGVISKPKPADPVNFANLEAGGIGAWEVAARTSALDLRDSGVGQGDQWSAGLGLNWFPNSLLKMSVNYIHTETDEPGGQDETVDAGLLRLQLTL
jgi:phosphate-selective porin OprO/OprP